jgi:leucine-rich repeat protein SHOC2
MKNITLLVFFTFLCGLTISQTDDLDISSSYQYPQDWYNYRYYSDYKNLDWYSYKNRNEKKTSEIRIFYLNDREINSQDWKLGFKVLDSLPDLLYLKIHGFPNTLLPSELSNLTQLEILELNGNQNLEELGSGVSNLQKLKEIDLRGCPNIKNIKDLVNLKSLKVLRFSGIKKLPIGFDELNQLETLEISNSPQLEWNNVIRTLKNFNNLKRLYLNGNKFITLPNDLEGLSSITELSFKSNTYSFVNSKDSFPVTHWADICRKLKSMKGLRTLDISRNFYRKELPEELKDLNQLKALNVSVGTFTENWTDVISGLHLNYLNVSYCEIKNIPEKLCHLDSLRTLVIGYNEFKNIPEFFKYLNRLCSLDISGSGESFSLDKNSVSVLAGLPLKFLNMSVTRGSENKITLPKNIDQLKLLEEINMDNTEINRLPKSFAKLNSLKILSMRNVSGVKKHKILNFRRNTGELTGPPSFNLEKNLDVITKLKNCTLFDFRGNWVSKVEIEKVQKLLPNCKVLYTSYY